MNIQEQIRAFEEKRAALAAANVSIMETAATEGTTLDAEQSQQFDDNEADIKEVDKHLERLRATEKAMDASVSTPVTSSRLPAISPDTVPPSQWPMPRPPSTGMTAPLT